MSLDKLLYLSFIAEQYSKDKQETMEWSMSTEINKRKPVAYLREENESLIIENENLKKENAQLRAYLEMIQDGQRFEAAKAAMQGMLSNADLDVLQDAEWIAKHARTHADALLKALEVKE